MFTFREWNLEKQRPAPQVRYGKSESLKSLSVCGTTQIH